MLVGLALVGTGYEQLDSGERRFNNAISQCDQVLVSLDPPVYALKKPTDVCVQLERRVPAQDLLAQFERQALEDRPWGVGLPLLRQRRQTP